MNKLWIGIILTLIPFIELRGGLPFIIFYVKEQALPLWPFLLLILFLNSLVILLIYFFLDYFHHRLMKKEAYKRNFERYLKKSQKKINRFQKRHKRIGFVALTLFTAIPLPITGAYSATLISWLTGLNKIKSFISISIGLIISETIILFITLGLI